MSVSSRATLTAGYVLAVPFSVVVPGFLRLWRRREWWTFAAEEAGVALIVAGWAQRRAVAPAVFNATWGLGLAAFWLREGRVRARRAAPPVG